MPCMNSYFKLHLFFRDFVVSVESLTAVSSYGMDTVYFT